MKKKLLLALMIFFITLSSSIAYSQVNKSLIDTTKVWSNIITNGGDQYNNAYTIVYKIGNDTIFDNLVYKKVMRTDYLEEDTTLTNYNLKFIVREDSNIVYARKYNGYYDEFSDEFIAYNFNLNISDTITLPIIIAGDMIFGNNLYVVDSVDSVLINNTYLKRIYLNNRIIDETEVWIEGIGSLHGLFELGSWIDWSGSHLGCAWQNDDLLYSSGNCLIYYGLDDVKSNEEIKLFPTIVKDKINISSTLQNYNISIYDAYGRTSLTKQKINQSNTIDISSFNNGVYIFVITNQENNTLKVGKIIKTN